MEENKGKRKKGKKTALLIGLFAVLALLVIGYAAIAEHFVTRYLPGTVINGIDVSEKTPEEAERELSYSFPEVSITEEGKELTGFTLEDVGGSFSYADGLQKVLVDEKARYWLSWILSKKTVRDFTLDPVISYNESEIPSFVSGLSFLQKDAMVSPTDAYIEETETGFDIVPETVGSTYDAEKVTDLVREGLKNREEAIAVDEARIKPAVSSSDLSLTDQMQKINAFDTISIDIGGGKTHTMQKKTVLKMLTWNKDDNSITVNKKNLTKYVQDLAKKYDTMKTKRVFTTHAGEKILVGGSYKDTLGYTMNHRKTYENLKASLITGDPVSAVYDKSGGSRGEENDFGTTYVEVSIREQHLWYYVDGKVALETDVVTGKSGSSATYTLPGVFQVLSKQSPATLVGAGYVSHVNYWMPVTWTGTGLHDATWRSSFGKDIYVSGGSHGCVNMPLAKAKELYAMIKTHTPVIIYDGSEEKAGESSET